MPTTEPEATEKNVADVPLYTWPDVAHHLRIPVWAVFALNGRGRPYPEWFFERAFRRADFFDDDTGWPGDERDFPRQPFRRLAEFFVRSAAVWAWEESIRQMRKRAEPWFRPFEQFWMALDDSPPAADIFDPAANGAWVRAMASMVPELDHDRLAKLRLLYLERVELIDGIPARLYPFSRDPIPTAPRLVVLNPRVRFGRPTLVGRGVPTDVIIDRFRGGDSAAFMAEDYDTPVEEIEEAVRYETRASSLPQFPFTGW